MSVYAIDPPESVAVAPTTTVLATIDTTLTGTLCVQVTNTDPSQTLACTVQRRAVSRAAFVDSAIMDLSSIGPSSTACVDIDCGANAEFRIVGTASGAGLTATIAARIKPRAR